MFVHGQLVPVCQDSEQLLQGLVIAGSSPGKGLEKVVVPFSQFIFVLSFHLKPQGFAQVMCFTLLKEPWGFDGTLGIKILLLPWPLEQVFVLESSTSCSVSSKTSNSSIGFLFLLPGIDGCGSIFAAEADDLPARLLVHGVAEFLYFQLIIYVIRGINCNVWDVFGELVVSGLGVSADMCYQKPVRAPSVCEVSGWGGLSLWHCL